jgi:DNA-binding NtrC family response regulator
MNIVVVDDDILMVESVRIGLHDKGHRVFAAYNAQEALDHLFYGGQRIDLVITDYLMPTMNGIDLLMAIRELHPTLPVLIMSAYAETKLVIEALRNKCDGFIEKPFTLEQLTVEIERIRPCLTPK